MKPARKAGTAFWVPAFLFFSGCAAAPGTYVVHPSGLSRADRDLLPRQSPEASEILMLQANENCEWFVDGQSMIKGKRVRVLVAKGGHQVVCKPDGYRAKEEFIQPPWDPNFPIGFTFLIEDKLPEGAAPAAAPSAPPAAPAAAALAFSDADKPPRTKAKPNPKAHAVVVGIETYRDLPKVDFASRDAASVRDYLVKAMGFPEENVILTVNERATRSDLQAYFETWLKNNVEDDGQVFVFFAGHGSPDPKSGESYLVPYDGNPSFLEASAYPLKRLYDSLAKLPTKNITVVMDSCFSGAGGRSVIARGTRPLVNVSQKKPVSDAIVVLAAASGEQISSFYQEKGHGLLTYFFLKGLQGAADEDKDGAVELAELFDYVKPNVVKHARKLNNVEQTPQVVGDPAALESRSRQKLVELK